MKDFSFGLVVAIAIGFLLAKVVGKLVASVSPQFGVYLN